MKPLGLLLVVLGLVGGAFAFQMDTSVKTGGETIGSGSYSITIPEKRVNNLGLMDDRRNYLYASGLSILIGVLLFGFGSIQQSALGPSAYATKARESAESITPESSVSNPLDVTEGYSKIVAAVFFVVIVIACVLLLMLKTPNKNENNAEAGRSVVEQKAIQLDPNNAPNSISENRCGAAQRLCGEPNSDALCASYRDEFTNAKFHCPGIN